MDNDEPPPEPPFGVAIFVTAVSWIIIYWAAKNAVERLGVWWAECLVYAVVPITATFIFLYRSRWRRELVGAARTLFTILLSCQIYLGVLIFCGIIITMICAVCSGFTRWHQ